MRRHSFHQLWHSRATNSVQLHLNSTFKDTNGMTRNVDKPLMHHIKSQHHFGSCAAVKLWRSPLQRARALQESIRIHWRRALTQALSQDSSRSSAMSLETPQLI